MTPPATIFFLIVGLGSPFALILADPDGNLPLPLAVGVWALAGFCLWRAHRLDPGDDSTDRYRGRGVL